MKVGQGVLGDPPDALMVYHVITMDQDIAKGHNGMDIGYATREFRIGLGQFDKASPMIPNFRSTAA